MKKQEALFILITTFILALAWIVFSILHSAVSSTISEALNVQISPIVASFDVKTIEELKKRQQITPLNVDAVVVASAPAQPTPTVAPTTTVSPTPSIVTPTNAVTPTP